MDWAAAQLRPNQTRLALRLLDLTGYQTYCPRIRERRVIRQRVVVAQPELFPGYAFILIVHERWYAAQPPQPFAPDAPGPHGANRPRSSDHRFPLPA
jgi:hypothetical protein